MYVHVHVLPGPRQQSTLTLLSKNGNYGNIASQPIQLKDSKVDSIHSKITIDIFNSFYAMGPRSTHI